MKYAWGLLVLPLLLAAPTRASAETLSGRVLSVQDGGHITVQVGNRTERVALIGVNSQSPWNTDCGRKAQSFTQSLVLGKQVTLETDRQERDAQGRLLAYVYMGNHTLVNQDLIAHGYATVDVSGVNAAHRGDLLAAQQMAKGKGLCVWRAVPQQHTWQPPHHWQPRTQAYHGGGGGNQATPHPQWTPHPKWTPTPQSSWHPTPHPSWSAHPESSKHWGHGKPSKWHAQKHWDKKNPPKGHDKDTDHDKDDHH